MQEKSKDRMMMQNERKQKTCGQRYANAKKVIR